MASEALGAPPAAEAGAGERVVARAQARIRGILLAPAVLVIGIFGILPLFIALTYSFLEPDN